MPDLHPVLCAPSGSLLPPTLQDLPVGRPGRATTAGSSPPAGCVVVGEGRAVPGAACLLLEPGQQLIATRMITTPEGFWQARREPAGSVILSPATPLEVAVLGLWAQQQGGVAAEHLLCSAGLVRLYHAVCEVQGWTAGHPSSQTVRQAGSEGSDEAAEQALTLFCALLGDLAGRLALAWSARGGVAVGGTVVPALGAWFGHSPFRQRFEAQAGAGQALRSVPTSVMPRLG